MGRGSLKKSLKWKLFGFVLLLNIQTVWAQDTLKMQYSLNASGTFKEGRLDQIRLPIRGTYIMSTSKWKSDLLANYKYQKTNGKVTENEFIANVLVSVFPEKKWFPVIGYFFVTSEFYQMKVRHKPGLGFGHRVVENGKNSLYLYGWGAYDTTKFRNISGYSTFRFNSLAVGKHEVIKDKLSFQYSLYYFQSIEESRNYIWRIEPRLLFRLSNYFSMSINLESHFENIVDPTNTKRNSVFTVGIQFQNRH